ncbi:MAG: hypothetical protein HIU81_13640 [Acidobacteria bacterium]|nr:hypothetical protein [Acidobacteriota bacterium]
MADPLIQHAPPADSTLAGLALVERVIGDNGLTVEDVLFVDVLADGRDPRDLLGGAVQVAMFLTSMLSQATKETPAVVLGHLRETILQLISDGRLSPEEDGIDYEQSS